MQPARVVCGPRGCESVRRQTEGVWEQGPRREVRRAGAGVSVGRGGHCHVKEDSERRRSGRDGEGGVECGSTHQAGRPGRRRRGPRDWARRRWGWEGRGRRRGRRGRGEHARGQRGEVLAPSVHGSLVERRGVVHRADLACGREGGRGGRDTVTSGLRGESSGQPLLIRPKAVLGRCGRAGCRKRCWQVWRGAGREVERVSGLADAPTVR